MSAGTYYLTPAELVVIEAEAIVAAAWGGLDD